MLSGLDGEHDLVAGEDGRDRNDAARQRLWGNDIYI
jgi:hypothetical protein